MFQIQQGFISDVNEMLLSIPNVKHVKIKNCQLAKNIFTGVNKKTKGVPMKIYNISQTNNQKSSFGAKIRATNITTGKFESISIPDSKAYPFYELVSSILNSKYFWLK